MEVSTKDEKVWAAYILLEMVYLLKPSDLTENLLRYPAHQQRVQACPKQATDLSFRSVRSWLWRYLPFLPTALVLSLFGIELNAVFLQNDSYDHLPLGRSVSCLEQSINSTIDTLLVDNMCLICYIECAYIVTFRNERGMQIDFTASRREMEA